MYEELPKNDFTLLQVYANMLHTYSRRLGGNSYNTYFKQNYLKQLELTELSASIILNDIINSEEFFLDQDIIQEVIDDNKGKLTRFGSFQSHFATFHDNNNTKYTLEEYWKLFDKSFQISQLQSQNNLKNLIKNILIKHEIKNPITKDLFNKKYQIEEEINQIKIINNNIENLNKFKSLKNQLNTINTKINYQNADQLSSLTNTVSMFDIIPYLGDGQAIMYFHQNEFGDYIFYLIHNKAAFKWAIHKDSDFEKNLLKILDYSRNVSNYNSSNFPFEESYYVYENLFLKSGVSEYNLNEFIVIGDGILSTFPFWLLLTDKHNSFDINKIQKYSWFSKKHNYRIFTSVSDFFMNKKNKIIRLGIQTDQENKILNIFDSSLAKKNNLQIEDKIISINDEKITNSNQLLNVLNSITTDSKIF